MEEMYRLLIVKENSIYKIERYNVVEGEWIILPDIYTNMLDAQIEVDILNEESRQGGSVK